MAKITLNSVTTGYNLTKINENFEAIEDALNTQVLYRDNPDEEENTVNTDIDMNAFRIINLPEPENSDEPVRLYDLEQVIPDIETAGEEALTNLADAYTTYDEALTLIVDDAETYTEEAKVEMQGYVADAEAARDSASISATSAQLNAQSVSEGLAETNALLGLGIGTSYVDSDGFLYMVYDDGTVDNIYLDANGFFILEF